MYKYEKSTWINGETILKAEHMQKIEQGIVDLQEELENVKVGDIDLSDYYTKTQTDDAMNTKADKVNTYTKAETDNKISEEIAKAQFGGNDKVDLSNYATKNYVDDEISKIGLKEGQIFASDFGVKADGVTDDTEALQLAIDKAKELTVANNSKITVILPKGTIVISNANAQYKDYQPLGIIKVYSNISLEGQGIRETVIRKPTSERELNGITMIYNEGCKDGKEYSEKNIAFKDFTITEGEAEPVHTNGSLITIGHCENLVFERVEGLNFDQHLGDILSCKNIHIKECRINNMSPSQKAASFQFDSRSTALNYNDDETITKDIFVYNNIFEHTNTPTGHLHFHICKEFENVNIYNNYFAGSGIVVDNKLEVRHITIDNNVFINADISAVGLMGANINNNSFDNGGISIGGTEKYNGNPVINDNIKINGNSFKGSVCCINVSSCDKVTVQGNVAENCGNFLASDANEIKVISNDIEVGEQVFLSSKSAIELNSRVDFIGNIIKIKGKNLSNLTKAFYSISLKYYFRCNISNNAITLFNEEYAHKISLFEGFETSHISINSNNIYSGVKYT